MLSTKSKVRRLIRSEWKQWLAALRKLRKIRRQIAKDYSPHGTKWTHNMLVHYDSKITELMENEPAKYVE